MKLLAIAVGVVAVVSLSGQTAKPTKPVLGAGATLCREWTGSDTLTYNADGSMTHSVKTPKDPVKVSWIFGYLSAAGVSGKAAQPGGEDYIMGWVSGSCATQPERTLAEVVAEFSGR